MAFRQMLFERSVETHASPYGNRTDYASIFGTISECLEPPYCWPNVTMLTMNLLTPASDLDMVRRHVENAQRRVAAQRKLIALIAARRLPLKEARDILNLYEATLQAHVDHLAHVEDIASRSARPRRSGERVGRRSRG